MSTWAPAVSSLLCCRSPFFCTKLTKVCGVCAKNSAVQLKLPVTFSADRRFWCVLRSATALLFLHLFALAATQGFSTSFPLVAVSMSASFPRHGTSSRGSDPASRVRCGCENCPRECNLPQAGCSAAPETGKASHTSTRRVQVRGIQA